MVDFEVVFDKHYECSLKSIVFKKLDNPQENAKTTLKCEDEIHADIKNGEELVINFTRAICFDPVAIFKLEVCFEAILSFRKDTMADNELGNTSWASEVKNAGKKYIGNLASLASLQIAQITQQFWHQPIITPPSMIEKRKKAR